MARKKKRVLLAISRLIALILIIVSGIFLIIVNEFNVLPFKYLILLVCVLGFFVLLDSWFLIGHKFRAWIKILSIFVSILIVVVLSLGLYYIERTYKFMNNIKGDGYITEKYYVLINKESLYSSIEDLKSKEVGTFVEKIELYDEAIGKYKDSVKSSLVEYKDIDTMCRDLMKNNIDAIIISEAHKNTMDDDLQGFKDSVKVLHEIDIQVKKEEALPHPDVDVKGEVFTIFISGSDSRGSITARSNSDVNMLVTINPNTYEILLVSIPRDFYVQLHDTTGYKDKLTHAGYYGIDMSINTIKDFLNVDIDYYVKVGFSTVMKLVDIIGGVDVYSDITFIPLNYKHLVIYKGVNHMNGEMALAFARERYAYQEGDRHRIQNQQDVLSAIIKKTANAKELLMKYTSILDALADCIETNFASDDITSLVNLQLDKMPSWTIKSYNLNGFDSSGYTYSYGTEVELWVMEPDYNTVKQASTYINGMKERKSFSELGIN